MPNSPTLRELLNSLLACTPEQLPEWIAQHRSLLSLELLHTLKSRYVDNGQVTAAPQMAERATRYGLQVAAEMIDEPFALPLAHWARGNWAKLFAPQDAIRHYRIAEAGYLAAGDRLSVARLRGNLIGVLTECGHFEEAEQAYLLARDELAGQPQYALYLLFAEQNYGWLLHNQGRFAEALAAHDRAIVLAEQQELTTVAAEIRVNYNLTLGMMGRLAEAEAGFERQRIQALTQGQVLTVARIDMNLGELYTILGRPADALRHFRLAQRGFSAEGAEMDLGWVMQRQAALLQRIGVLRSAIRSYTAALEIATRHGTRPQMGELLLSLAAARRQQGEYTLAASLLAQAQEIWNTLGNSFWLKQLTFERIGLALDNADANGALALVNQLEPDSGNPRLQAESDLLLAEVLRISPHTDEQFARASACYSRAANTAQLWGDRWLRRRALTGHGRLLLRRQSDQARQLLEQAALLDDKMRQALTVEELKASFHQQVGDIFSDLVRLAIENGETQQALAYIWRAKASAFFDLMQAVGLRRAEMSLTPEVHYELEQTRNQLATLRWRRTQQANLAVSDLQRERSTPEIAALEERLLELRRFAIHTPGTADLQVPNEPAVVLPHLTADMLIEFFQCGDELIGVTLNRAGDTQVITLADSETVIDLCERLQLSFHNVATRPPHLRSRMAQTWLAECLPLLRECHRLLIQPLLPNNKAAVPGQRVLIAPCEALAMLPFAAFWDGHHFWAEIATIEQIPSGALLALPPPATPTFSPSVVIAAAAGTMTAVRSEAESVAATLPHAITFIDAPALAYFDKLVHPPRCLHIAAHSVQRDDAPIFTGLQLTGEVLSVEACYDLPLCGTELVTLSGCTTASGQETGGALLAFQTAFFVAGAKYVVSSLWPVADDATAVWMERFYRFLADGLPPADAMQQTQQTLLAVESYCHPAIWAAFVCTRR